MKKNNKVAIVAGGTGGHVFPACVFSNCLIELGYNVDFYTDERGVKYIDDNSNFNIHVLIVKRTFLKGVLNKLVGILFLIFATIQSFFLILFNRPKFVIGFGGYISVPVLICCLILGVKIVVHEQNAYLGRSNRMFKFFAKYILTSFENTIMCPKQKQILVGMPVRDGFKKQKNKQFLKNDVLNVLVTGGSQGAQIFGDVLPDLFVKYKQKLKIVQQVRIEQIESVKKIYSDNLVDCEIVPFIDNMDEKFLNADIVICRSGSSTVFECLNSGVPALYVPYKYAADNHQYYNAKSCMDKGCATLIEQDDFNENEIEKFLNKIFSTDGKKMLILMSENTKNCITFDTKQKFKDFVINKLG